MVLYCRRKRVEKMSEEYAVLNQVIRLIDEGDYSKTFFGEDGTSISIGRCLCNEIAKLIDIDDCKDKMMLIKGTEALEKYIKEYLGGKICRI